MIKRVLIEQLTRRILQTGFNRVSDIPVSMDPAGWDGERFNSFLVASECYVTGPGDTAGLCEWAGGTEFDRQIARDCTGKPVVNQDLDGGVLTMVNVGFPGCVEMDAAWCGDAVFSADILAAISRKPMFYIRFDGETVQFDVSMSFGDPVSRIFSRPSSVCLYTV